MAKSEKKEVRRPRRHSQMLCCGPDLLTVRSDLNNALAVVEAPRQIEVFDMHLKQNPCLIVKGKKEELEKLKKYLVLHGRYVYP